MRSSQARLIDETLADAHQLRELLVGIVGLLQHPARTSAVDTARRTALEACATVDRVVADVEAVVLDEQRVAKAGR